MLLITSRESRRWVIPKGNPIAGLAPHEAAAREALEEAGITGAADPVAIGRYRYSKRRKNGAPRKVTVTVFPLAFAEQLDDWLEQGQRDTRWFDLADAAAAVDEPDLRRLIARFRSPSLPSHAAARRRRANRSRAMAIAAVLIAGFALYYALARLIR